MRTFLFWNIQKKPLEDLLAKLAETHLVDVVVLAECDEPARVLLALNKSAARYFYLPSNARVAVFTRFSARNACLELTRPHFSIHRLVFLDDELVLVAAHLRSKRECKDQDQDHECIVFARTIVEVENKIGNRNTIIIGDLNMNPFQAGIVSAAGLHAVMTKEIANKRQRVVNAQQYRFFYNPMWKFFGDGEPVLPNGFARPSGTCYFWRSEMISYFWNIFDQVLIRPELIERMLNCYVITSAGTTCLVTERGIPNRAIASDHLPLVFSMS